MRALTNQGQIALAFVVTVIIRFAYFLFTGFTADDAFITFRYAENLAAGLGLVYNDGQQVLGTTTPLFTFIIALFRLMSFPPINAALLVSLVASGCTAVILFRFARALRLTHLAAMPVVLYIVWPRLLPAETCGMETALFTCLVTAAIYYNHKGLSIYALAMATLSTLTRPEGAWLLLLLLINAGIRHRHTIISHLIVPVTLIVPWIGFSWYYFGTIVPHSATAKLVLYEYIAIDGPLGRFWYVMGFDHPGGWVLLVAAVLGAVWLNRKQNFGWIAIAWVAGLIVFYTGAGTKVFFWYLTPMYPMLLLFATAAIPLIGERARMSTEQYRRFCIVLLGVTATVMALAAIKPARYYREYQGYLDQAHKAIGLYLKEHARTDDLLAAEDIGYMGYYSKLPVLDRDGLISPETLPYLRSDNPLGLVLDHKPDWVVTTESNPKNEFTNSTAFREAFRLERRFGPPGKHSYDLWRAIEK